MQKKNVIILFILSILFFSLSLVGVYIYGQTTTVWHSANEITPGTFQKGNYYFENDSTVYFKAPGTSTGTVTIGSPSGNPGIVFNSNSPNYYRADIERTDTGLSFDVHAADSNPSSRLFINNDGNVGIGTVNPQYNLQVSGTGYFSNLGVSGGLTVGTGANNEWTPIYVLGDNWWLLNAHNGDGKDDRNGGFFIRKCTSFNQDGSWCSDWGGWYFGITSSGNVGIGTTSPSQKLDVSGYIKASTGFCIGTNCITSWPSGGGLSGSGTTNYIAKWTGNSSLGNSQIYDNGTNVGIGTTSPSQKLHVSGNILGSNLSTAGSVTGAIFYDNDNTDYYVDPKGTSYLGNIYTPLGNIGLAFGSIGIGTYSPSGARLHILSADPTGGAAIRIDQNNAIEVGTPQVSLKIGPNEDSKKIFRDFYIRTIDNDNDFVITHTRVLNTVLIQNGFYGGKVRIFMGGGIIGKNPLVDDPSPCGNGAIVCIRDGQNGDTAQLHVKEIHVSKICLKGVCKESW